MIRAALQIPARAVDPGIPARTAQGGTHEHYPYPDSQLPSVDLCLGADRRRKDTPGVCLERGLCCRDGTRKPILPRGRYREDCALRLEEGQIEPRPGNEVYYNWHDRLRD